METWPRILRAEAEEPYILRVTFGNGVTKIYDCYPLLEEEVFKPLKNRAFFKNVHVDPGGYAVIWNDYLDLSEAEIWRNDVAV